MAEQAQAMAEGGPAAREEVFAFWATVAEAEDAVVGPFAAQVTQMVCTAIGETVERERAGKRKEREGGEEPTAPRSGADVLLIKMAPGAENGGADGFA